MSKEAMKLALEALEESWHLTPKPDYARKAITALQKELAEQPAQQEQSNKSRWMDCTALADAIHYPDCWDTVAYPKLNDALHELAAWFKISGCTTCAPQPAQPEKESIAALLLQSKKNHERNFGPSAVADWIYSDLLELLDTEPPKRQPLTEAEYMKALGPLRDEMLCSAGTLQLIVTALESAVGDKL